LLSLIIWPDAYLSDKIFCKVNAIRCQRIINFLLIICCLNVCSYLILWDDDLYLFAHQILTIFQRHQHLFLCHVQLIESHAISKNCLQDNNYVFYWATLKVICIHEYRKNLLPIISKNLVKAFINGQLEVKLKYDLFLRCLYEQCNKGFQQRSDCFNLKWTFDVDVYISLSLSNCLFNCGRQGENKESS